MTSKRELLDGFLYKLGLDMITVEEFRGLMRTHSLTDADIDEFCDSRRVILEDLHVKYADDLARRRYGIVVERDLSRRKNDPGDDDAMAMRHHIVGARGEAAAKLFLNPVRWNTIGAGDLSKVPDFEGFIDAKTRDQKNHRLILQEDDEPAWAYLLVCGADHPEYRMLGWAWGHELKQPRFWSDPKGGRPAFFIPPGDQVMRDARTLIQVLRDRQGEKSSG